MRHCTLTVPKERINSRPQIRTLQKLIRTAASDEPPDAFSGQDYIPEALGRQQFYDPPERGFEREIRKRLEYWARLRRERRQD